VLKLEVSGEGFADEAVICFNPQASYGFDRLHDARNISSLNINSPDIYTYCDNGELLSINAYPELIGEVSIPVSVQINASGTYNLSILISEFELNVQILLEDKLNGSFSDLRADSSYTFEADLTDHPDRFIIHFIPVNDISAEITSSAQADIKESQVKIFSSHKDIYVDARNMNDARIEVYDLTGRLITSIENNCHQVNKISMDTAKGQMIVCVKNNQDIISSKVLIY